MHPRDALLWSVRAPSWRRRPCARFNFLAHNYLTREVTGITLAFDRADSRQVFPLVPIRPVVDLYVPSSNVLFQRFPDGAVLYTPSNETYLGLNETGARIWGLLPREGVDFERLVREVAAIYPEAPEEELRTDLTDWLNALVEQGLARRELVSAA